MAENVLTVTWRWPWTVHAGWCDFAIVEMNTKSRKLCKIRRSLQFFSKLAQIFSRFGPRRVMWHMYHNTHQDNTLVDSRASGVSTAERSHSRTNIAVKGRAEQFRAISQFKWFSAQKTLRIASQILNALAATIAKEKQPCSSTAVAGIANESAPSNQSEVRIQQRRCINRVKLAFRNSSSLKISENKLKEIIWKKFTAIWLRYSAGKRSMRVRSPESI